MKKTLGDDGHRYNYLSCPGMSRQGPQIFFSWRSIDKKRGMSNPPPHLKAQARYIVKLLLGKTSKVTFRWYKKWYVKLYPSMVCRIQVQQFDLFPLLCNLFPLFFPLLFSSFTSSPSLFCSLLSICARSATFMFTYS